MAIAFRDVGTVGFGQATRTVAVPAAQLTGDMMLLIASGKSHTIEDWTVTAGWNALASAQSGTTGAGVDVGSMVAQVWWKEATSDTEADPTLTEVTAWNVTGSAILVFSKDAGETWETPVVVYGGDETSGTAISATMASDPGVTAGDHVVCFCGINTDAMGPLTGDLTPTQTGVTFGAVTERVEAETTLGGDMTLHATDCAVSSGTGSAAPVLTGTGTASGGADRLEAGFIRLRVSTPPAGGTHPGWITSSGGWF